MDLIPYQKYYKETELWKKLSRVGKKVGIKAVYAVLLLFYASVSKQTSLRDKVIIYGALGYFVLPLDLIPDALGLPGYSDDLKALLLALKNVWQNITPEVQAKARARLTDWFGHFTEQDIQLF